MKYQPSAERYDKMQYKYCGNSGLLLPRISLGLWHNFGSVDDFGVATDMIKYAFASGLYAFTLSSSLPVRFKSNQRCCSPPNSRARSSKIKSNVNCSGFISMAASLPGIAALLLTSLI